MFQGKPLSLWFQCSQEITVLYARSGKPFSYYIQQLHVHVKDNLLHFHININHLSVHVKVSIRIKHIHDTNIEYIFCSQNSITYPIPERRISFHAVTINSNDILFKDDVWWSSWIWLFRDIKMMIYSEYYSAYRKSLKRTIVYFNVIVRIFFYCRWPLVIMLDIVIWGA